MNYWRKLDNSLLVVGLCPGIQLKQF